MSTLLHILGGGVVATIGHTATAWIKGHFASGEVADVESAIVAKASYRPTDWEHFAITVLLIALMVWAVTTGQPQALVETTQGMAVASVGWFTGRLVQRRTK